MELSRQLVEVASWHMAAELVRRDPVLRLIQTHPAGGTYDCLTLLGGTGPEPRNGKLFLNRPGSATVFTRFDGRLAPEAEWQLDVWPLMASTSDPRSTVDRVCDLSGIPKPPALPVSTRAVVSFRFIARVLQHSLFSRAQWRCVNAYHDSSGTDGSSLNEQLFENFPTARRAAEERRPDDVLGVAAYRFWFLTKDQTPLLCISSDGLLWNTGGQRLDLFARYRNSGRNIERLVNEQAGDLLP